MRDELEQLDNGALNRLVAKEVLGREIDGDSMLIGSEQMGGQAFDSWLAIPSFSECADAVMPYLQNARGVSASIVDGKWLVKIVVGLPGREVIGGEVSFARAACIALVRAMRFEKGGAS